MVMKLEIKKYGINGEGIAYDHSIPVFIKGALVGEIVDASIVEDKRKYKIARINKLIKTSSKRAKVQCKYYKKCGACALLHVDYAEQLNCKKAILEESLAKYASVDIDAKIETSPKTEHYRNALKLPIKKIANKLVAGLYEDGTNRFIRIDNCLNHDVKLQRNLNIVLEILNKHHLDAYDHKAKRGIRYITLRLLDGKCALCLVSGSDEIDEAIVQEMLLNSDIVSIYQSINTSKSHEIYGKNMRHLGGSKALVFTYKDMKMEISIRSFMQLNTQAAFKLYDYVYNLVDDDNKLLIEAYSGLGLMSFLLHEKAEEVVGIEIIEDAVHNANANVKRNKIDNITFITGDCADVLYHKYRKTHIDTLIVDPPRTGLDDRMLECLLKAKPDNIIYISCNPSTLSKNIHTLLRHYSIESIRAFDLFPNTQHVETVVLLSHKKT